MESGPEDLYKDHRIGQVGVLHFNPWAFLLNKIGIKELLRSILQLEKITNTFEKTQFKKKIQTYNIYKN